jgi:hypothetical protein
MPPAVEPDEDPELPGVLAPPTDLELPRYPAGTIPLLLVVLVLVLAALLWLLVLA